MLTGYPPFQSKTQEEIYKKVRNLSYVWPKESDTNNFIPEEAKDLVAGCLNLVDEERPDPDDIVEHAFFNMYDGCIPRQLDPASRFNRPLWLKDASPRGDAVVSGYGLDSDEKLRAYVHQVDDPAQRYHSCKAAFYSLCGVGRKPDGMPRKSVGRNCSKSAFSECDVEDSRGLRPVIPLAKDFVYRWPHDLDGDWCVLETSRKVVRADESMFNSSTMSARSVSTRPNPVAASRTNAALAAAQQRRMEGQSHAATLRQQARVPPLSPRRAPGISDLPASSRPYRDLPPPEPKPCLGTEVPAGGLAERPIRTRRMASASQATTLRSKDKEIAPQLAKSTSMPNGLTVGKTRSQSRRLAAADQELLQPSISSRERQPSTRPEERKTLARQTSLRSSSRADPKAAPRVERRRDSPIEETAPPSLAQSRSSAESDGLARSNSNGISRSNSKTAGRARSSLGLSPLFHSQDLCEHLPRTSLTEVNTDLRLMLSNLVNHAPSRRRGGARKQPHAYVIKWVDYTNRYGIGYVLDDGSVGCVFKGENGQPATSVVVRDGERHIRRKARSVEDEKSEQKPIYYSEADQLVPRTGPSVEFYENRDDDLLGCRGIRRALISPSLFDIKTSRAMRVRTTSGTESERADAEKIKRMKLVDQFGKYMIGALGRHGDEGIMDADLPQHNSAQFIKFYQRLGNVGIWGFGDGAFQFNFPDHTKLVISPGRTRSSSPWIDFYHLSPSAARYFATKGKMHPAGFDTRAVASDEAATFLSIANGDSVNSTEDRIRDILDANSFIQKIAFIKDTLRVWIKFGRLGGRPPSIDSTSDSMPNEAFWQGTQERPQPKSPGTKFVWVTVGAPDGDGHYRSVMFQDGPRVEKRVEMEYDQEMDRLKDRLRALGR
jgi:hypothetical protein